MGSLKLFISFLVTYMCMGVCIWVCECVSARAHRVQKRVLDLLELVTTGYELPSVGTVLGTELKPESFVMA